MIKVFVLLAKFFESNIAAIVHRVLAAAGIGIIGYAVVVSAFEAVVSFAHDHYNSLPGDVLALVGLAGIGEAIGLLVGAMTFKLTVLSVKRLGLKQ
ncbi:MAG: DUF2523 family protein [Nitrosomonas sp.]|uniref:DUF2523 family protein n=1 Tax=Nitrosomonas sp. TaxID=42353 RepID=UPI002AB9C01A|nr:DUF2523 family protein [Nitrosomonas sp.]MDZ4106713.1 DUF2523 family protein [Nitrosomonas sp.]MDZ4106723.1 DUF2523 family protein [Nitrosomonas sp.]